jgi:glutathione S-transferase
MTERITLFYAPQSRATGMLALMEELGVPYDLEVLSLKKKEHPMGKVPAVLHKGALVTEQPAVYM